MASLIKKVLPMLDYMLIQRSGPKLISKAGIVLNEKHMGKTLEGKIVAVGPGKRHAETGKFIPIEIKVGDYVLLPEYGGIRVEINNDEREYLLFRESEILAKFE